MKYLLDTCVISDFVNGELGTLDKIKCSKPSDLAVPCIVLMEIHYGLKLNPQKATRIQPIVNDLLNFMIILPYSAHEALMTAEIRAHLKQQGTPIGSYDLLIAATALQHQLTLVTANENEFTHVKNLRLENWRNISI